MEVVYTEVHAFLQAVHFAIHSGFHLIELETDCIALKTALNSNTYDASIGGLFFREIKFMFQVNFIDVQNGVRSQNM